MPRFVFQARANDGERVNGYRQGVSASAVAQELSASGLLPLTVEASDEVLESPRKTINLFGPRVNINELVVFSHQMTSLTKAGISVVRAVKTLGDSNKNPYLTTVLNDVAANLEAGMDLASCLGRHPRVFNELYVSLIHVGENTGRLDEAFRQIAQYLELERETRRRMQAATRYPMFVMVAMAIAVVILNIFVIPAFAQVFAKYGAQLPWQTRAILGVSDFFVAYWPVLLVGFGLAAWSLRRYVTTDEGRFRWHRYKLRLPILGSIFERIYLARFCHTFAMVSRAGVPLTQGLQIVSRAIGSEFMARKVAEMRSGIERGESLTQTARAAGLFTPVVMQMIAVGEETGAVDDLLEQAAGFYEEEVEYALRGLTDALEPLLIVGIAGLVLIMALGVFLPLWDLNSVAN